MGARADAADIFSIFLSGPDDERLYRAQARFGADGRYRFSNLPEGRYWLSVDSKADVGFGPNPSRRTVSCQGRGPSGVDFEFR